jgi:hypothetical protein
MSSGFQQQENASNLNFSRSAPTPQHGRKADKEPLERETPPRSLQPPRRPGQH